MSDNNGEWSDLNRSSHDNAKTIKDQKNKLLKNFAWKFTFTLLFFFAGIVSVISGNKLYLVFFTAGLIQLIFSIFQFAKYQKANRIQ